MRRRRPSRAGRIRLGALEFNRTEADPVVVDGQVHEIKTVQRNRATDLIEDFMVAANETMADFSMPPGAPASAASCARRSAGRASLIWSPLRNTLPAEADSAALSEFLQQGTRQPTPFTIRISRSPSSS